MNPAAINAAAPSPEAIIAEALRQGGDACVISTNFRPGEAVLLHLVAQQAPRIPVIWVDHGYNTPDTYRCAERIIAQLRLDVRLFVPRRSAAHREAVDGAMPGLDEPQRHAAFTEEVKLEPFRRALANLRPRIWFTALRRSQTAFRAGLAYAEPEISGLVAAGHDLVKVSPILDWSDADMAAYLARQSLPDETIYFDPTKVDGKRECGLHPGLKS
jgi:phosphoadenosine phosphosulfate reductase